MEVKAAYDQWASQYDTNVNRTRDMEAKVLRETLEPVRFSNCLEIGCGTGKNTAWLETRADHVTAVDLSEEMMSKAKEKIISGKVKFIRADILEPWHFVNSTYDLITFSLVLEHIEHLDPVFEKAGKVLAAGGYMYISELHPFKQYSGSKARFETEKGVQVVTCFNHHISDFTNAATKHGFRLVVLKEYFDDEEKKEIPRLIHFLFQKE